MTKRTLENTVDELGMTKAAIADLEQKAEALAAELRRRGPGAYEGRQFRATVSGPGERERLDLEWARKYLGPILYKKHVILTPTEPCVRVVARNGENLHD